MSPQGISEREKSVVIKALTGTVLLIGSQCASIPTAKGFFFMIGVNKLIINITL